MTGRALPLLAACTLFGPAAARGHDLGISYSEFSVDGDRVDASFRIAARDLSALEGPGGPAPGSDARAKAILASVEVALGEVRCPLEASTLAPEAPDGWRVAGAFRCPGGAGPLRVRLGMLAGLPWGHTHLAKVAAAGGTGQFVLRGGRDAFEVRLEVPWPARATRFLRLGVEHIFTGYDHIAFLLGLLLLGGTLGDLAKVVTSFTVAHSLTLALAGLGLVRVPASVVEPLIAASIVCVAAENLLEARRPSPHRRAHRWRLGFAFGLVHGLGFADALRELSLSRADLLTALFSFNVGVELGQALLVAVAFPLLLLLRRQAGSTVAGLRPGSIAIGVAGLVWLVRRLPP